MSVNDNEQVKLMCNTAILTEKRLESNRPNITIALKSSHERVLIDFGVPCWDMNIGKAEIETQLPGRVNQ